MSNLKFKANINWVMSFFLNENEFNEYISKFPEYKNSSYWIWFCKQINK